MIRKALAHTWLLWHPLTSGEMWFAKWHWGIVCSLWEKFPLHCESELYSERTDYRWNNCHDVGGIAFQVAWYRRATYSFMFDLDKILLLMKWYSVPNIALVDKYVSSCHYSRCWHNFIALKKENKCQNHGCSSHRRWTPTLIHSAKSIGKCNVCIEYLKLYI